MAQEQSKPTAVAPSRQPKPKKAGNGERSIRVPLSREMAEQMATLSKEKKLPRSAINKAVVAAHVAAFKAAHGDAPSAAEIVKSALFG